MNKTASGRKRSFLQYVLPAEKESPKFLSNCQSVQSFKEHEACWELKRRGSVGESIIHLAMLGSSKPPFKMIVHSLLNNFPKLALDVYEGNEYKGLYFGTRMLLIL